MVEVKGKDTGDFIVSEANGMYRSREQGEITAGAEAIAPGQLVGKVTATGVYAPYNSAGVDGTETIAGVLFEGVGVGVASGTTVKRTFIVRDAELNGHQLVYGDGVDTDAADAALADLGLIVRR